MLQTQRLSGLHRTVSLKEHDGYMLSGKNNNDSLLLSCLKEYLKNKVNETGINTKVKSKKRAFNGMAMSCLNDGVFHPYIEEDLFNIKLRASVWTMRSDFRCPLFGTVYGWKPILKISLLLLY